MKWLEAEQALRECFPILEKTQPDVWTTYYVQAMLGNALLNQKKFTEAEPHLVSGYEGMKERFDKLPDKNPSRPAVQQRISESLDRLIQLYNALDKPDQVKKYQELRAKYQTAKELAPMPRPAK
jgi:hypothetical protein